MIFISLFTYQVSAQDWRKIVPAVSTCKDIKKIFKVQECKLPRFEYKTPEYDVIVFFSDGKNSKKIPKGKVKQAVIIFNILPKLKDFKDNLSEYKIKPVYDLPDSQVYENKKKGISLEVVNNEFIQTILLNPVNPKVLE